MRPIQVTVGPLASASANAIALSQSVSGASAVVLNGALVTGGVATLDKPRRVLITSSASDAGITFTVVGTTFADSPATEVLTGGAVTAASVTDFKTITSITTSGSTAGTITVGTNGVAGSSWVTLDPWAQGNIAIQTVASGTVNYTVQQTLDDPNSPWNPVSVPSVTWVNCGDTSLVAATATQQSTYIVAPAFTRVLLNSGTGTVVLTLSQMGEATL